MENRGAAGLLILAGLACGAPPPPVVPLPPPRATIAVAPGTCLDIAETTTRVEAVLRAHHAIDSGLRVQVQPRAPDDPRTIGLEIVRRGGERGLDRQFTLSAGDCQSAPQLIALSVDRWLAQFPEWAVPPPAPPPPPIRWNELAIVTGVNALWSPLGLDGQLGALLDRGGAQHRFGGSVLVRGSLPQRAGTGSFQQTALLIGATWRHRAGAWELRAELRGGGLWVHGLGFAENGSDWLPWWEAAISGARRFGWGTVGVELAATPLGHRAVTRDGLVSEDIPRLRLGLVGIWGLGGENP